MFERRRFNRYQIHDNGLHVFDHHSNLTGKIRNVGRQGLGFDYTPTLGRVSEPNLIDIIGTLRHRFYILGIHCRKIFEITVLSEDRYFRGVSTRCCGLQFVNPTPEQRAQLEFMFQCLEN
ncbi:MAG: hypothetical protein JSW39_24900 [Desulfobacterales bacterium]|nr:MAG: hypothetical protein JSW39_24900 [Desulfobacterales bacterium]